MESLVPEEGPELDPSQRPSAFEVISTSASPSILVVDDDRAICELVKTGLAGRGIEVVAKTSASDALGILVDRDFSVVVTDLEMQGMNGLDLCARILENRPDVPVVVMTAFGSLETAVAAIRAGAYDFITKPFAIEELELAISRAVKHRSLQDEMKRLRRAIDDPQGFDEMIGKSAPIQDIFDVLSRVSETEATVLITGESGTGKELIAQALHRRGRRRQGPFVAVNCAAMPESLLEGELFGHAKGAFTDAKSARSGLFVTAQGGTLFLDEIGEMPLGMQVKLLRALQERTVRPIGSSAEIPFDTRIVAATNRDLDAEVSEGRFREDLFYRINVVRIHVPPLRERGSDVVVLAQHFIERFAQLNTKRVVGLSSGASERLMAYTWPGNVRELQNCMERAVALTRYEHISVEDLPEKIRTFKASSVVIESDDPSELPSMDEVERRYILKVLAAVGGNKTQASEVLGFDRKTLYRKLDRFNSAASHDSSRA